MIKSNRFLGDFISKKHDKTITVVFKGVIASKVHSKKLLANLVL